MDEIRYTVQGGDRAGGAGGIRRSLARVDGVHEVTVDPGARTVTVRGSDVEGQQIRAALAEAGYAVVDAAPC
ncbi:heavy-metal-associated domain-containing protein [Peterkaempfera bronchialis]|uniref:Copper chaperone n=1 Tax=Peterkaempfera bronchialis TaxID=2126346 RepID=A0A345SXB4_9ACTN|nr:heavy-metal-associated domain-containing protein [Peterkaempfera bronchialis]AXI78369.1 copper chaperone [Peterkaempfera bronchialis]